ncbi:MAG: hypothetical protein CMI31_03450 [Opitutae bacterium]|nr:hypothetical protein [Opitutae bacterium]|tara:strand:- start:561 stop:1019 length:459 start_codon:yes stop_codon:yes gene_type:complete
MIEIDLHLSPIVQQIATPLLEDVLHELSGKESFDEKRYAPPPEDPDLRETWLVDLREHHASDLASACRLFSHSNFGTETPVQLQPDDAEAALRGLTTIRLKIRDKHLSELDDTVLELADFGFETLPPPQQQAYLAYALAAATQERIIHLLEP